MRAMAIRTAGPIKTKLGIGTHVDPGSVLVKVKVIYVCVWYNRIHACATWRITMNHARSSISSSSGAVAGATWWVLIIKNPGDAPDRGPQGQENPSRGRVIIQLVIYKVTADVEVFVCCRYRIREVGSLVVKFIISSTTCILLHPGHRHQMSSTIHHWQVSDRQISFSSTVSLCKSVLILCNKTLM